ncbi:hypothetical protein EJ06DRAFT_569660 [Trichodelitschia bisporula]|uniref:Deoxyribonuclease NucA/NucB domain-containing protein n=1 Tax=Trichodelitschia bisporula TaxID=703511 RepID=A0A6G1HLJ2_9PEZI|nr:hypothetical protein EJ06DRAFT_569660 [Trichodelitschia bisporula]
MQVFILIQLLLAGASCLVIPSFKALLPSAFKRNGDSALSISPKQTDNETHLISRANTPDGSDAKPFHMQWTVNRNILPITEANCYALLCLGVPQAFQYDSVNATQDTRRRECGALPSPFGNSASERVAQQVSKPSDHPDYVSAEEIPFASTHQGGNGAIVFPVPIGAQRAYMAGDRSKCPEKPEEGDDFPEGYAYRRNQLNPKKYEFMARIQNFGLLNTNNRHPAPRRSSPQIAATAPRTPRLESASASLAAAVGLRNERSPRSGRSFKVASVALRGVIWDGLKWRGGNEAPGELVWRP